MRSQESGARHRWLGPGPGLAILFGLFLLAGCDGQVGGCRPVASIARDGFARDRAAAAEAQGREIELSGFVDHGNLYGDAGAKPLLQDWWAGEGPSPAVWRFNLKAGAEDAEGRSLPEVND